MGQAAVNRISDIGVPCILNKFIRQRVFNYLATAIFLLALKQKANLRRIHWLPQHWKIFHHQYPPQKESM